MKKKKSNYMKSVKPSASLQMSSPSDRPDSAVSLPMTPKSKQVFEEELPWGEVIVEFAPNDTVPLNLASEGKSSFRTGATSPQQRSIPFGTIIHDDRSGRTTRSEPASKPAERTRVRLTDSRISPVRAPADSPENSRRSESDSRTRPAVESKTTESAPEEWTSFEIPAGPPLAVMTIAVAVVVILFLLVQSS